jgi:hypothetical protein
LASSHDSQHDVGCTYSSILLFSFHATAKLGVVVFAPVQIQRNLPQTELCAEGGMKVNKLSAGPDATYRMPLDYSDGTCVT